MTKTYTISTTVYGAEYVTNLQGQGVFKITRSGDRVQCAGTGQTPTFTSKRQLGDWIRRNLAVGPEYQG